MTRMIWRTLFALKEFDIRGVILDNVRGDQKTRSGRIPVEQMMQITRRQVKYAAGLPVPLENSTDQGYGQVREYQEGVELIVSCLRESKEKVVLFSTGSCRDLAAAFNRDPQLFKAKVEAVYSVIGTGGNGESGQYDYNSKLDPWAYFRLFETGVPFYWCTTRPKMTEEKMEGPYSTNYLADQGKVLPPLSRPMQNFFVYCLTRSTADPLAFLDSGPNPLPGGPVTCGAPVHCAMRPDGASINAVKETSSRFAQKMPPKPAWRRNARVFSTSFPCG